MVCDRCIKVLKNEVLAAGIELVHIELGKISLKLDNEAQLSKLKAILTQNNFELIISTEDRLTEAVKIELIKLFNNLPLQLNEKLSDFLAQKLSKDYSKISKMFSYNESITIEKYFIKLKIEKVKELIKSQDQNFTEIGQLLDYSNVNHLSRQFKKETGMSLTEFKESHFNFRNSLDQIL